MIKKVIILFIIFATLLLTTIDCIGQLKDFYSLNFPEDVKYEKAVFESVRDNGFRLIIKYSHKGFNDFIKNTNTTYVSTEGQNFGSFSSTIHSYNSTPFYSSETKTYICYSTHNGIEYIELYSTRYFENIDKFNNFKPLEQKNGWLSLIPLKIY